jgi:hypothetical protein
VTPSHSKCWKRYLLIKFDRHECEEERKWRTNS